MRSDTHDFIVTVTINPAVDLNTAVDVVEPDHKLRCEAPTREAGGGGVNVARAIRKLGGAATAILATSGKTGALLADLVAAEQIAMLPVSMSGETRESINVYERSTRRQYRFILPSPEVTEHDLERLFETVRRLQPAPRYLVGSGSVPESVPDFYARLSRIATSIGARFVVDTSGEALREVLATGAYLLKPNLKEFSTIIGRALDDEASIIAAARDVVGEGRVEALVISRASAGALLVTRDETTRIVPPAVVLQSQVGAGDSMVGAATLALARGATLVEAIRYGVAAGTATCTTPGTELCRLEDVARILPQVSVERLA